MAARADGLNYGRLHHFIGARVLKAVLAGFA
jgi:hypothetical protein